MADFAFNIAKGKIAYYTSQAGTGNAALIVLALATSGLESDATLLDKDTVADLVSGSTNEVTNTGYARKTITSATVTVDDTNDRVDLDIADQTWSSVAAGDGWSKIVIAYDADTTAGTDANLIPLTCHDYVVTPDGSNLIATISNFGRAA